MSLKLPAVPDPEEIAGRYQVLKRLGSGAFGTVFKVKDKVLGRMLAIKTIRLEGLAASGISVEELMDRFRREAQISAQLKHPNIVTIYDVGEADGMSYLAMEFIDGVGLDRVIASAGRLPLERAALIGAQVADALDFAHRHSVVHRDVKPANIMVEAGDRVKVTDFGIAKVTDSGDHLTMTGSLLGTPSYMSPEQAKGGRLDGRSDLFAVGAIVYEMLGGQKAFRGDSITGLIFKIITEEPPPLNDVDPTIPAEMAAIVQRALCKTQEGRYQTGRELAEALLAFSRAGSSPTLRQAEIDTMRGAGSPPTVAGQAPTITNAATQGRAPAAPPRPVEPTMLSPSAAPPPPAVDPTYLVGSGARPPGAPPPRPPAPAAAAPTPPRPPVLSAAPAPPRPGQAVAPQKSKTGLIVGIAVGAVLLVALLGGGAVLYLMKPPAPTPGTSSSGEWAGNVPTGTSADQRGAAPATDAAAQPTTDTTAATTTAATSGAGTGADPAGAAGQGVETQRAAADVAPASRSTAASGAGVERGSAGQPPQRTTVQPPDPQLATRPAEPDLSVLDRQPPELTGRESGASVADTYRSSRGSGGGFGASGRLRARARVPADLAGPERKAAWALMNIIGLQAVHHRRTGRYGTFQEVLPVRVGSPDRFNKDGYRFELKLDDGGFTVMATSLAGRALIADDSGFVRYADE